MMRRREGGRVMIDISEEEYVSLIAMLAYAAGNALGEGVDRSKSVLRLLNSINDGDPNWTPLEIGAQGAATSPNKAERARS